MSGVRRSQWAGSAPRPRRARQRASRSGGQWRRGGGGPRAAGHVSACMKSGPGCAAPRRAGLRRDGPGRGTRGESGPGGRCPAAGDGAARRDGGGDAGGLPPAPRYVTAAAGAGPGPPLHPPSPPAPRGLPAAGPGAPLTAPRVGGGGARGAAGPTAGSSGTGSRGGGKPGRGGRPGAVPAATGGRAAGPGRGRAAPGGGGARRAAACRSMCGYKTVYVRPAPCAPLGGAAAGGWHGPALRGWGRAPGGQREGCGSWEGLELVGGKRRSLLRAARPEGFQEVRWPWPLGCKRSLHFFSFPDVRPRGMPACASATE